MRFINTPLTAYRLPPASILLLVAMVVLVGTAAAQEQRSLRIRDGKVLIDGKPVSPDRLPASLDVHDLNLEYSFSGDIRPIVAINGNVYALEDDRLVDAGPGEHDGVSVFLHRAEPVVTDGLETHGAPGAASSYRLITPSSGKGAYVYRFESGVPDDIAAFAPHAEAMGRKAKELQEHVVRMEELQGQLQELPKIENMTQLEKTAREMTLQAGEAVRVAESMPRIELQQYLEGIHRKDKVLFNQLVNEREKERETIEMARRIRAMEEGPEREKLTADLREKLSEIFDLKQANRQEEVKALEERLTDLTAKLDERERLREDIISRRLRQLLNLQDELNW